MQNQLVTIGKQTGASYFKVFFRRAYQTWPARKRWTESQWLYSHMSTVITNARNY